MSIYTGYLCHSVLRIRRYPDESQKDYVQSSKSALDKSNHNYI